MAHDSQMTTQVASSNGFIAALDQSGGSTPSALRHYGIEDSEYAGEDDMYRLMHDMRIRIMTSPAFSGDRVIGAILFEKTMDGDVGSKAVPSFLWEERRVVPFLKIDKGLASEENGVQVMKPLPDLDALLSRAVTKGIFGTKMRSLIHRADRAGIAGLVDQQVKIGRQVLGHGLVPIIEPEVSIKSETKQEAEAILLEELLRALSSIPEGKKVMVKVTIPTVADLYQPLVDHPAVLRVVALSGGYSLADACEKLRHNHGMIASFSRALTEDLRKTMRDDAFNNSLERTIGHIYDASVEKV